MYNHHDPLDNPPRPNRISFYLFNPAGGLGVGSYVQVPIHRGRWMQIVGVADSSRTYFYKDGQFIRCDTYRGPAQGSCEIHYQAPPNQDLQLVIHPQAGAAPLRLGTKDLGSFFEGGLTRVRLWNRALAASEISALYATDMAPKAGLVGEFLLNVNTGTTALDVFGIRSRQLCCRIARGTKISTRHYRVFLPKLALSVEGAGRVGKLFNRDGADKRTLAASGPFRPSRHRQRRSVLR